MQSKEQIQQSCLKVAGSSFCQNRSDLVVSLQLFSLAVSMPGEGAPALDQEAQPQTTYPILLMSV